MKNWNFFNIIEKFKKIIKSYLVTFSLIINNFTNIIVSYMEGPISTTIDYLVGQPHESLNVKSKISKISTIESDNEVSPVVEEESWKDWAYRHRYQIGGAVLAVVGVVVYYLMVKGGNTPPADIPNAPAGAPGPSSKNIPNVPHVSFNDWAKAKSEAEAARASASSSSVEVPKQEQSELELAPEINIKNKINVEIEQGGAGAVSEGSASLQKDVNNLELENKSLDNINIDVNKYIKSESEVNIEVEVAKEQVPDSVLVPVPEFKEEVLPTIELKLPELPGVGALLSVGQGATLLSKVIKNINSREKLEAEKLEAKKLEDAKNKQAYQLKNINLDVIKKRDIADKREVSVVMMDRVAIDKGSKVLRALLADWWNLNKTTWLVIDDLNLEIAKIGANASLREVEMVSTQMDKYYAEFVNLTEKSAKVYKEASNLYNTYTSYSRTRSK